MSTSVFTYNPKEIKIACGNHVVTGVAEDSFVTIDPHGDGFQVKVGCYGDVNRAIPTDKCQTVKISLLQNSPTNTWFEAMHAKDQEDGTGYFSFLIKDLMGNETFSSDYAFVNNYASKGYGKESTNREWELTVVNGTFAH
jgi:hypothetical protein